MLLGANNTYHYTQSDQQLPPSSMAVTTTSPTTKTIPTVLKLLLIFVILQLLIVIGIMIVLIVFGYIGYTSTNALVVDQLNCNNYYKLFQYENRQSYFMKITFTTTIISILLTIVLLIITIKSSYQSVKLPDHVYPQQSSTSLTLSTLYIVIGSKTRPCLYIIQSICLLCILVVLGYYLIVYLQFNNNSCQFNNNTDTMLHILIVWVVAVVGFIIGWIVWIIIVVINIKNRSDYVQEVKQKQEQKEQYKQVNNTQMDNTKKQLIRDQEKPTQNSPGKRIVYGYYDPVEHKYQEPVQNQKNQLRKVGTLDSQKQQQVRPYRGVIDYYDTPNKYQSNQRSFENRERRIIQPVREDNYKYRQNQRKIQPHLAVVPTEQKQPQFKRSRFNSNPKQYDSKNNYFIPQQDPYSTQFAKFRQADQQKDMFKSNQQRKILPQSDYSSPNQNGKAYEGTRPKLHGTYFKDQTSQLNKKRGQNTEEKKKRKGILNDYIRGKYMEG